MVAGAEDLEPHGEAEFIKVTSKAAKEVRVASPAQDLQPGQDPQWPVPLANTPVTHSGQVVDQGLVASPHQALRFANLTAREIPPGRVPAQHTPLLKCPGVDRRAVSAINMLTQGQELAIPRENPSTAWEGGHPSPLPLPFPKVLENIILTAEKGWGDTHLPDRLQLSLTRWKKWASPQIVSLISSFVLRPRCPFLPLRLASGECETPGPG